MVALPAACWVGLVLTMTGFPRVGAWAENVTLLLMITTAIAVLVPPRGMVWFYGLGVAIAVAANFGDDPWPGLAIALVPLVWASALEDRPHSPAAAPSRDIQLAH